ncbi:MAG: TRAP transporter substrate-binding protein [Desulfohalobiaceae bacterium]|nr:TRAP transporter substrate-binding protein [Desulfohalobiaceae bacterium]MCF8104282.1 TRAP transporter substrate-binding protein [Desulfohalobiaceae bacterium]
MYRGNEWRKFCWIIWVGVFVLVFSVTAAQAAKKIKVATVALPETNIHQALVKWQELLDERSDGQLQVKILDRGVMGGDKEMISSCRMATLDTAVVSGSVLSHVVPEFFMVALPYLFNNHDEANAFLDGPMGQKLFAMLEEKDLVGLGWATWSFRGIWNNARPIEQPEDLKGLKIRTVETKLDMSIIREMGGVPTPLAWSEALMGMRQGTVDGISTTYGLGYHLKLYEMSDYATRTKHYYESAPLIMSKKVYDGFSSEEQEMIKNTAAESLLWSRKQQESFDDKSKELLQEKGVEVNSLSEEAFQAFRDRTRPIYEEFRPKIGSDFMDKAMDFIQEYRSEQ